MARQPLIQQTTCEVCGGTNLRQDDSKIGRVITCADCGTGWDYYFRKDGALLSVPPSWEKVIAVAQEVSTVEKLRPEEVAPAVSEDYYHLDSELYYICQAEDGTIRRARLGSASFARGKKPRQVPAHVAHFHFWVVDVCPATGNTR